MNKKLFLKIFVGFLIFSALIGIYIFAIGDFDELEMMALVSTASGGFFSLMGLVAAAYYEKNKTSFLGKAGVVASVTAFILSLFLFWEWIDPDYVYKIAFISFVVAPSIAHACLLFFIDTDHPTTILVRKGTIGLILLTSFFLIGGIMIEFDWDSIFWRLIGIVGILNVLGTIATPIMHKIVKPQ